MTKDYRKAFDAAKNQTNDEMEKMIEQSIERYAALGIDFMEETTVQQFISNLFGVSEEDAIEVYELVSAVLTASPSEYAGPKEYETAMRDKLEKLSRPKAALFGAILSLQMKAEIRMRMANGQDITKPKEAQKEDADKKDKAPIKRKPTKAVKEEKVTLDEDGDPEGAEPIYVPNFKDDIPGYW